MLSLTWCYSGSHTFWLLNLCIDLEGLRSGQVIGQHVLQAFAIQWITSRHQRSSIQQVSSFERYKHTFVLDNASSPTQRLITSPYPLFRLL